MTPMWHPMWDPLWEAVNETQLPLHFHTFPATDPELRKSLEPTIARRMTYSGLCRFQMTLATILTDLMGAAVFERFPNIRVVFGESGIGWIPYVIDRMDFEYQDQYQDLKLKMLPSEYWRRQCKATFQFDRVGTKLIDEMGDRDPDVGLRLPASRRRLAGIEEVHRRPVQPSAGRCHLQDDLRERRQILRPDQLAPRGVRHDPPHPAIGRVLFAYPAPLCPAPVPPVLAGQEQDAGFLRPPSGCPRNLVQQMQEQPGGERRARAVLDDDLPRASDLELAEKTGRRTPHHRLQSLEAGGSGGIAGIGGDRRRRRSVHLDLLLNDGARAQGAEDGQYINHLENHGTL